MEGGGLALDLAHGEMGAVRYLLAGKPIAPLDAALPAGSKFPTEGDIGTDGDTSATLKPLFGGGGVDRLDGEDDDDLLNGGGALDSLCDGGSGANTIVDCP